jgi:hypothetical protein
MDRHQDREAEDSSKSSERNQPADRKKRIGKRKGAKSEVPAFLQIMYSMIEVD